MARAKIIFASLLSLMLGAVARLPAAEPTVAGLEFFERKVRPLFADHCYSCHGEEKQKGHLRLDSPAAIRAGGDDGIVVVPGEPKKSRLVIAVGYQNEDLQMPPKKRLSAQQVAELTEWVKLGAPMPADDTVVATAKKEFSISDKDRAHWAFQAMKKPPVPAVSKQHKVANPIDNFIIARLETKGFAPNAPATKRELIRRAYYDLLGLPPTPEEVEAFLADTAQDAWEKLIDRLLDSPQYGEKWGRHWLDLVRYAETNSYERDGDKPNAWRYRDYVIRSFNQDKPYNRFVTEQLAGDELPQPTIDSITATGFYRLGIWDDEPADRDLARYDSLDDIVATTGQVFLGQTVDCARCHNHKIDPIPQKDYYRLLSFFQNINSYRNGGPTDEIPLFETPAEKVVYENQRRELEKKRDELQAAITKTEELFRAHYAKGEHADLSASTKTAAELQKELATNDFSKLIAAEGSSTLGLDTFNAYEKLKKELVAAKVDDGSVKKALAVTEAGTNAPETFVLVRGNPNVKGDKVEPGFLEVLGSPIPTISAPTNGATTSGRRTALADWITSPQNPLTARVMANRLWQYHFGRGIVRSPNNFGLQGDAPTHPELLDWLASEFIAQGWRMKPMHRLIMTSQAYRMSSSSQDAALKADPANDLFWRFDMRRLTAEEIRDSILAYSGTLNLKMSGPGIFVEIPKEVTAGQSEPGKGWGKSPVEEQSRRSIYIKVKRSLITPILASFDLAETDRSAPARFNTVQPTQALGMINGEFLNQQAELFASRLRREVGDDTNKQVRRGLYLVTSRPPTELEIKHGVGLIDSLRQEDPAMAERALHYFCLMALNLNEMIYLD